LSRTNPRRLGSGWATKIRASRWSRRLSKWRVAVAATGRRGTPPDRATAGNSRPAATACLEELTVMSDSLGGLSAPAIPQARLFASRDTGLRNALGPARPADEPLILLIRI